MVTSKLISGAWLDELQAFAAETRKRLLIATPWIKYAAAQLLLQSLPSSRNIVVRLIARFELDDFLSGASDLQLFYPTFPPRVDFRVRAMRNLHAKVFIGDDRSMIVGSANLTEGGLYRNQEAMILSHDPVVVAQAAKLFEEWWASSTDVSQNYLQDIHEQLEARVTSEDDPEGNKSGIRDREPLQSRKTLLASTPWVPTRGAEKAKVRLARLRYESAVMQLSADNELEDAKSVLEWLERRARFVPVPQRSDNFVERLNRYMHHADANVRATAVDRVGRLRITALQPTVRKFLADPKELPSVRAASAFALALFGDPACFGDLVEACGESGDIARWARRGCFMLLARVDVEQRLWFLSTMKIESGVAWESLLAQVNADTGTNSQRLAKTLLLEKLIRKEWDLGCMDLLAFAVFEMGRALNSNDRRIREYVDVVKTVSNMLRVPSGDLKHSFLSIAFIRSVWAEGWPSGLVEMFGERWRRLQIDYESFVPMLRTKADVAAITRLLWSQ